MAVSARLVTHMRVRRRPALRCSAAPRCAAGSLTVVGLGPGERCRQRAAQRECAADAQRRRRSWLAHQRSLGRSHHSAKRRVRAHSRGAARSSSSACGACEFFAVCAKLTQRLAASIQHPTLRCLPASVKLHSFDEVYESSATLQDVYPQARRRAPLSHAWRLTAAAPLARSPSGCCPLPRPARLWCTPCPATPASRR